MKADKKVLQTKKTRNYKLTMEVIMANYTKTTIGKENRIELHEKKKETPAEDDMQLSLDGWL